MRRGFRIMRDAVEIAPERLRSRMAVALGDGLRAAVAEIARLVRGAGGRALMVGGAVRDLMLGGEVKDVDVEVFGVGPERLMSILAGRFDFDQCGVAFGVLKLKRFAIDVSLPRRESKRGLGHRAFMVASDPALTVAEAARRRDFTVNAMYLDPLEGEFEDPYGGAEDLRRGILRRVSSAFAEDPLRVLRGMQFAARFELTPDADTLAACRAMTPEGLAAERLFEEWSKLLLKGKRISRGLAFLRDAGWTRYYPELAALIGCKQAPEWHPEGDVWNHTCCCLDAFAASRTGNREEDLIVGLAVLCHDFGKPATSRFDPAKGRITAKGHDDAGVEPTLRFLRRLTNEERILKEVPPLVQCHMRPFSLWKNSCSDAAIRRLAAKVTRIDRLLRVAAADDAGRPPFPRNPEHLEWLAEQAQRLKIAAAAPRPILMGRHLVEMGMKPSAKFGAILKACFEAQLDGKFSDLPGATAFCRNFISRNG